MPSFGTNGTVSMVAYLLEEQGTMPKYTGFLNPPRIVVDNTKPNTLWAYINKNDGDLYNLVDAYVTVQTDKRKHKKPFYQTIHKRLDEKIEAMPSANSVALFGAEENNQDFFKEYLFQISRYCDERRGASRGWGNSLRVKTKALEQTECEAPIRDKVVELGSIVLGDVGHGHVKWEDRLGCMYEVLASLEGPVSDFEKHYLNDIKEYITKNGTINSQKKTGTFTRRLLPIMRDEIVAHLDAIINEKPEAILDLPAYNPAWDEAIVDAFRFESLVPLETKKQVWSDNAPTTELYDGDFAQLTQSEILLKSTGSVHGNEKILSVPDENIFPIEWSDQKVNMIHQRQSKNMQDIDDLYDSLLDGFDLASLQEISDEDVILLDDVVESSDTLEHLLPNQDSSRPAWLVNLFAGMERHVAVPSIGLLRAGQDGSPGSEYRAA